MYKNLCLFISKVSTSKISNVLSVIFELEPLNSSNYSSWMNKIDMVTTLVRIYHDIDNAKIVTLVWQQKDP
jgi:hypothetical protein